MTAAAALRVLMITSEWPVPDGRPRTTFFIKRQAEFLRAAGVDVDVFHFKGAGRPWNYVKAWLRVRRRVARGQYDLVHAQFGQSGLLAFPKRVPLVVTRSEEHTSELQSQSNLVCRLLLEKKKH